jgi:hypothetical protein
MPLLTRSTAASSLVVFAATVLLLGTASNDADPVAAILEDVASRTAAISPIPDHTAVTIFDHPPAPRSDALPPTRREFDEKSRALLAQELSKMWVRDPRALVEVIHQAFVRNEQAPSLSLLLAIAHAETNGRILIVSEAGAVGLAQATPSAYLSEGYSGKLFVTRDYVEGSHAYIMKKPLSDADEIATLLMRDRSARNKAHGMLAAAREFRREGIDELLLLAPYGTADFHKRVERADRANLAALDELERLIDHGSAEQIEAFRDRVRGEYRAMITLQRASWKKYQQELIARRDDLLRRQFNLAPDVVHKTRAYEAGEFLANELDERFSPTVMADFLVKHLGTKMRQAIQLGTAAPRLDEVTSALYNGGSHNVLRMDAGLIPYLKETENYRRKVPATQQRLDSQLEALFGPLQETRDASGILQGNR